MYALRKASSQRYLLLERRIHGRLHQVHAIGARQRETDRAGAHREQKDGDGRILRGASEKEEENGGR